MTPAQMAQIHAAAFKQERGWSAAEFADLLAKPHIEILSETDGFALVQTTLDEAELLTLAVVPDHQRKGIAQRLITRWISTTQARDGFLEVAADNTAAIALYSNNGFARAGLRKAYYKRTSGPSVDALLMTRSFTQG